jgi:quercetin dioxygenase-like cupin family protein
MTTVTEQLWFLNALVKVRVGHDDGGDGISVLESRAPQGESPPLHVHHAEDEAFYVLEGELRFRAGGDELRVGPGESVFAATGVPHTYRVESPDGARWLTITTRGDFERFVRSLSRPAERSELPDRRPPTPGQVQALADAAREHGIDLIGPPLDS